MQIGAKQIDNKILLKLLMSTFIYILIEFLILFGDKKNKKDGSSTVVVVVLVAVDEYDYFPYARALRRSPYLI